MFARILEKNIMLNIVSRLMIHVWNIHLREYGFDKIQIDFGNRRQNLLENLSLRSSLSCCYPGALNICKYM